MSILSIEKLSKPNHPKVLIPWLPIQIKSKLTLNIFNLIQKSKIYPTFELFKSSQNHLILKQILNPKNQFNSLSIPIQTKKHDATFLMIPLITKPKIPLMMMTMLALLIKRNIIPMMIMSLLDQEEFSHGHFDNITLSKITTTYNLPPIRNLDQESTTISYHTTIKWILICHHYDTFDNRNNTLPKALISHPYLKLTPHMSTV